MEHKILPIADLKLKDDGSGTIEGYASTFENWDDVGERPVKGAFKQHLSDFLKDGFIAIGHNWSQLPIATPTKAREDDKGLYVEAQFHSTPDAQAARTVVKERLDRGKSVKLSIGYEVLLDEYVPEGRLLKDVKLYEWSIVTVPANRQADVTTAKGLRLESEHDAALAAVLGLADRYKSLFDLRTKEGRVLSDQNRKRIAALLDALETVKSDLQGLLSASEPKPKTEDVQKALAKAQALVSSLRGATHEQAS